MPFCLHLQFFRLFFECLEQLLFAVNWVEKWSITKYEREKKEQLESGEENKNQMGIECPISWHPKKRMKKVQTTDKEWQTHTLTHSHTSSYKMSETFVRLWHHWNKWLELKWMSFACCVFFRRNEGMKEQCASTHTNIPCYEYFKGKARVNADEKGEPNETLCVLSHNHHHRTTPHHTIPQLIPISSIFPSAQPLRSASFEFEQCGARVALTFNFSVKYTNYL